MNRTQAEAEARRLGIKHPQRYNLKELRIAIDVRRLRKSERKERCDDTKH